MFKNKEIGPEIEINCCIWMDEGKQVAGCLGRKKKKKTEKRAEGLKSVDDLARIEKERK